MTARRERWVARIAFGGAASNALDLPALESLGAALARASADPGVRVIVLTSGGESFCTGLDLDAALRDAEAALQIPAAYAACAAAILGSPKPVFARVHGPALGGGCALAAACDFVIASQAASFALPEAIVGMIPAIAATVLRRRLAPGALRSLALTASRLSAEDALRVGLIDALAPADRLDKALDEQLDRVTRCSPAALASTKRWLGELSGEDLDAELGRARDELVRWMKREDVLSGARAFVAGHSPPWFES